MSSYTYRRKTAFYLITIRWSRYHTSTRRMKRFHFLFSVLLEFGIGLGQAVGLLLGLEHDSEYYLGSGFGAEIGAHGLHCKSNFT